MREIKFRAWDKCHKCMEYMGTLYWFEENGVPDEGGIGFNAQYDIEQFTGIRGKNGKEIYEGDIIQVHHVRLVSDGPVHKPRVAEIKWLDDDCGFRLVGAEVRSTNPDIYPTSHLEVIGNIHENPELLK